MTCDGCDMFTSEGDLKSFLKHLRARHRQDHGLKIVCIVRGCSAPRRRRCFRTFQSYYRHCLRAHGAGMAEHERVSPSFPQRADDQQEIFGRTDAVAEERPSSEAATAESSSRVDHGCQYHSSGANLATTVYELKLLYSVPQVAITNLVDELQTSLSRLSIEVQEEVQRLSIEDITLINSTITSTFQHCLGKLATARSEYSQKKEFGDKILSIEPCEILLGKHLCFSGPATRRLPSYKNRYMYYISVSETLKMLSLDTNFQQLLSNSYQSKMDPIVTSFEDGTYHEQSFSTQQGDSIYLILYYDDVEMCNPLGSYVKTHKLAMFYYTLTCIPQRYRSRLQNIFLLGIAYSADVKKFGIDKILKPFCQEMQKLATTGIFLPDKDMQKKFRCYLVTVSADTPAANLLCGFKEGVGLAYRKCRHCMATAETMAEHNFESEFELRSRDVHERQASEGVWRSRDSGVTRRSCLLDIPCFDMLSCAPHDVMHILFEGVIPYTLKQVLNDLIVRKLFSLEQLNYQIEYFPYSANDKKDKPAKLTQQHLSVGGALRQSSSQMWCLFRLIPIMTINYNVSHHCESWQCMVILMELTSIVMSPRIPFSKIAHLEQLIALYLTWFKSCFKDVSIIPKQHYLVHIPSQIRHLGPPIGYWCMRFEAKHAVFKQLVTNGMFKNVAKSLTVRHQRVFGLQCMRKVAFTDVIRHGVLKPIPDQVGQYLPNNMGSSDLSLKICKWVIINGIHFYKKSLVILPSSECLPNFCQIEHIILVDSDVTFVTQHLRCRGLDENLNSFVCQLHVPPRYTVVRFCNLGYYDSLSSYSIDGQIYIPQKVDYCGVTE